MWYKSTKGILDKKVWFETENLSVVLVAKWTEHMAEDLNGLN